MKIFAVNSREATLTGRWLHSWKKVAVFLAAILIWRELCFLEKKPRNTLCGVLFSTEFQCLTILNEISEKWLDGVFVLIFRFYNF